MNATIKKDVLAYLCVSQTQAKEYEDMEDAFFRFYDRCRLAEMHYADADRYAILNTLLGYDVGMETARKIDGWLYEHDIDGYELDADAESKEVLMDAARDCDLDLDFSNWATEPIKNYTFFD